jgi:hypothetical protein
MNFSLEELVEVEILWNILLSKSFDKNVLESFSVNGGLIIIVCCSSRGFHSECQIDVWVDVDGLGSKRRSDSAILC